MCFPAPLRPAPDLSPTPWSGHPLGGLMTQPTEVAAAPGAVQPPRRRDRRRAATMEEIIQTARQLLVKDGPEAVSLRAIAREMGMTAPGLYRCCGVHEELLRHVGASIFAELARDIHRAIEAVVPEARAAGDVTG